MVQDLVDSGKGFFDGPANLEQFFAKFASNSAHDGEGTEGTSIIVTKMHTISGSMGFYYLIYNF